jgi:hypothetical protein
MQFNAPPTKWTIPFANSATIKTEVPPTSADDTRASLSLGFPARNGQPPEAGGVPPQQSDFNGALNQIARAIWWTGLGGNRFAFDSTFALDSNISGYARGAVLMSADGLGEWVSTADGNTVNPDTVGTNWIPRAVYGVLALTGQTGGTVTLTPAQAAKRSITVAGTLTSNLVLVVPNWTYEWTVFNNTTGAFTVTIKTAAGTGAVVPQNGAPTPARGDGTNVNAVSQNIAPATSDTQAATLGQTAGRLLDIRYFRTNGTYTPTAGTRFIVVEVIGGGGAGGSTPATTSGQGAVSTGGSGGGWARRTIRSGFSGVAMTVGLGGAPVAGGQGGQGGTTSFGSLVVATGGFGGGPRVSSTFPAYGGTNPPGGGTAGDVLGGGQWASQSIVTSASNGGQEVAASGGSIIGGAVRVNPDSAPANAVIAGAGGSGVGRSQNLAALPGGSGADGLITIWEYA